MKHRRFNVSLPAIITVLEPIPGVSAADIEGLRATWSCCGDGRDHLGVYNHVWAILVDRTEQKIPPIIDAIFEEDRKLKLLPV